jgi:hypothetical protein
MTGLRLRTEVFSAPSAYYGGRPCFAVVVLSPSSHTLLRYSFNYLTNKHLALCALRRCRPSVNHQYMKNDTGD